MVGYQRCLVLAVVASVGALWAVEDATAGVRGKVFEGSFTNSLGATAESQVFFFPDGSGSLSQDFGTGVSVLSFSFTEVDLILLSFWQAEFSNPKVQMSGIGLFGIITTMSGSNRDFSPTLTFRGSYRRIGNTPNDPGSTR